MADRHWEPFQDDLLDGLPDAALDETERLANEVGLVGSSPGRAVVLRL